MRDLWSKFKNPFTFFTRKRTLISYENGNWELIKGSPEHKMDLPTVVIKDLLFLNSARGKKC